MNNSNLSQVSQNRLCRAQKRNVIRLTKVSPIKVFSECIKIKIDLSTMVDDNHYVERDEKFWEGYVIVKTVIDNSTSE